MLVLIQREKTPNIDMNLKNKNESRIINMLRLLSDKKGK